MRVTDADARRFYEAEAVRANWSRRDLQRQINSLYHQRLLASANEEQHRPDGDNPPIGLILCSEKNEAVARYSVLHESQQLFASRYRFTLPSEEELQHERALIENQMDIGAG
jgi:hypothetical protein